jgi:predicted O-methyltransferase YrrM
MRKGDFANGFYRRSFRFWERLGFHISPINFDEPIPDTRTLKDDLWQKQSELVGININEKGQIDLLSLFSSRFKKEYESLPRDQTPIPYQYYVRNRCFGTVDGEILYCMIRYFKPRKIIEVGSGYSTYLSAQALLENRGENNVECELTAIDPYPNDVLKAGFRGLSKLMPTQVQDIPLSEFDKLNENDILFIDSSHVLKIGSDVQYEYLEIMPRLKKGVIIHIHDIILPAEYFKRWITKDFMFFNEQYLLQAFLAFNNSFEVQWAASYMHLKHSDKLEAAFSSYKSALASYKRDETWPGSFWIRKTK